MANAKDVQGGGRYLLDELSFSKFWAAKLIVYGRFSSVLGDYCHLVIYVHVELPGRI